MNNSPIKVFVSGKFKVIHTGHLRFLKIAKNLGDWLIVGIDISDLTEDETQWRVDALSNLSVVDEVHTFKKSPIPLLEFITPHIILKGKEFEGKFNPEADYAKKSNASLIFSSGDSFFSEYDLLERRDLRKLNHDFHFPWEILERHQIHPGDLASKLSDVSKMKILVVGDLIVDEVIQCHPLGMSSEEPTVVVTPIDSRKFIGGAGIVAAHCSSLGAQVTLATCIGSDSIGNWAINELQNHKVKAEYVVDSFRPTTLKQRFRSGNHTLLKLSHLREENLSEELSYQLLSMLQLEEVKPDVVIFSDFSYGLCNSTIVQRIMSIAKRIGSFVSADSQSSSQIGSLEKFRGANLITATERELRNEMKDNSGGIVFISTELQRELSTRTMIVKMGADGCLVNSPQESLSAKEVLSTEKIPALNLKPLDVSGAGDSLLAVSSIALALGMTKIESTFLGAIAAGIQVGRVGNIPIGLDAVLAVLRDMELQYER